MNKVVILTGGSSGIGRATTQLLRSQGCTVYEFSRRPGCLTASKQARQRKRRVERYFFVNIKIHIYTLCHGML